MTATLAFVRHGETQPNVDAVLLGRTDVSLTEHGRAQAGALGTAFAGEAVTRVISSPLARAVETARTIAARHDLDVLIEPRLIELDYGEWEGRALSSIAVAESARWRRDPAFAPPAGESLAALHTRVAGVCNELAAHDDAFVVAVTHVSPVKAAVGWTLGAGPEIAWRMHLRLASITRILVRAGVPVLLSYDEVAHLG